MSDQFSNILTQINPQNSDNSSNFNASQASAATNSSGGYAQHILQDDNLDSASENQLQETSNCEFNKRMSPFDISKFSLELKEMSEEKNKGFMQHSKNINGYSVAHECIGNTVKKILGVPVPSYTARWLPLYLRSTIGSAIHDFIQDNTSQMTEIERSIKVPSIRFSGRLDGLIG